MMHSAPSRAMQQPKGPMSAHQPWNYPLACRWGRHPAGRWQHSDFAVRHRASLSWVTVLAVAVEGGLRRPSIIFFTARPPAAWPRRPRLAGDVALGGKSAVIDSSADLRGHAETGTFGKAGERAGTPRASRARDVARSRLVDAARPRWRRGAAIKSSPDLPRIDFTAPGNA